MAVLSELSGSGVAGMALLLWAHSDRPETQRPNRFVQSCIEGGTVSISGSEFGQIAEKRAECRETHVRTRFSTLSPFFDGVRGDSGGDEAEDDEGAEGDERGDRGDGD